MRSSASKPHFLIIGHGGTIGMLPGPDGSLRPAKSVDEIVEAAPKIQQYATFELIQVTDQDSVNLNPSDWTTLCDHINRAAESDRYDGILVIHGTDTLPNTAAAIGYAFGPDIPIHVNFTGAQKTISQIGSDAQVNLEESILAMLEALKLGIKESTITFGHRVLRGARAMKRSEAEYDAFWSPSTSPLATIDALGVHYGTDANKPNGNANWQGSYRPKFSPKVFTISVEPGLQPEILDAVLESGACDGLLIRSLGTGNVPTEGEFSLLPIIDKAVNKYDIPVLISTKFPAGTAYPEIYETGKLAVDAGAIGTGDLTEVAAHTKFMWALGQGVTGHKALQKLMLSDYIGDVTGPKLDSFLP